VVRPTLPRRGASHISFFFILLCQVILSCEVPYFDPCGATFFSEISAMSWPIRAMLKKIVVFRVRAPTKGPGKCDHPRQRPHFACKVRASTIGPGKCGYPRQRPHFAVKSGRQRPLPASAVTLDSALTLLLSPSAATTPGKCGHPRQRPHYIDLIAK
jgi:hypothetical protein